MVNTHKKGQSKELLCQKELEKDGWRVVFRSRTIKQGPIFMGIDIADLFDIVALNEGKWRFISVKHKSSYRKEHLELINDFRRMHGCQHMSFECWVWHPNKWEGRGKNKKWVKSHWLIL